MPAWIFTSHARLEMLRRGISEAEVIEVLTAPHQQEEVRPGRTVYQSLVNMGGPPKAYVLRVFVDTDRDPAEIVTVYRTSKVAKYWR